MGSKSASLLTKKQRSRIENGFADLDEEQARRERQRIRNRVCSGVSDFRLLADYPDREVSLALEELDEDDLRAALADATLFLERLRELEGIDRDELVVRARGRAEDLRDDSGRRDSEAVRSLADIELRTEAEVRREAQAVVRDEFAANPWDERADRLLKLTASAALPLFGLLLGNAATAENIFGTSVLAGVVLFLSMFVFVVALTGVSLIKVAQILKHDIIPAARTLRRDPEAAVNKTVAWVRRPGQTLRRVWDEL